eukprot:2898592-Amphidinium_carterae.1
MLPGDAIMPVRLRQGNVWEPCPTAALHYRCHESRVWSSASIPLAFHGVDSLIGRLACPKCLSLL